MRPITKEEILDIYTKIQNNDEMENKVIRYFGKKTNFEAKKICKLRDIIFSMMNGKTIVISGYYCLLIATDYERRHHSKLYKGYEEAQLEKERTKRKRDLRCHTCKEKILDCISEIDELKKHNATWQEIRTYLKKEHRTMFYYEKLSISTLRQTFYEWQKDILHLDFLIS